MRSDLTPNQWVASFGDKVGQFHTANIHLAHVTGFVMIHESCWNRTVLADMANELAYITRYASHKMEIIH